MPTTASLSARSTRHAERGPWEFLTTLLAAGSGPAQRLLPPRRPRTKPHGDCDDGCTRCGWFDSSQDLRQGLSVAESFVGQSFEWKRGPLLQSAQGPTRKPWAES